MVSTRKAAVTALMALSVLLATCDAQLQFRDSKPKRGLASLGYGFPGVAVPAAGSLVAPHNYFFRSQPGPYLAAAAPVSLAGHYAAAPAAPAYAAPAAAFAAPHAAYAGPHATYSPAPAAFAAPHAAYSPAPAAFAAPHAAYSAGPAAYAAPAVGAYAAAPAGFPGAAYAKPAAAGFGYLG